MIEDRSVGTLLGLASGDILGAPVKGMEATVISASHGKITDFLDGEGKYTDDTQLAIALADSLVEHKKISLEHVPTKYSDYYNPLRGYPESISSALDAITKGMGNEVTGRVAFREGSYGSGASSRIAPIGIAYRHADDDTLHKAVVNAVVCTHTHPQSVDAAFTQAKAIGTLVNSDPKSFNLESFLSTLQGVARTETIKNTLGKVQRQVHTADTSSSQTTNSDDVIGNGFAAADAIGTALLVFSRFWKTPEAALVHAISLGGDTDTIGAHTGALLGALHGSSWIPKRWYDKVENGKHGRDFIIQLAKQLATLDVTSSDGKGEEILKKQDELIAQGGEFEFEQERKQHVQDILAKIDVKIQRITSK